MTLTIFRRCLLKTRITLLMLLVLIVSTCLLAFYASWILQDNIQQLLGERQFTTVSYMANEINGELSERVQVLTSLSVTAPMMSAQKETLQAYLQQQAVLLQLFNDGVVVYQTDGSFVAEKGRNVSNLNKQQFTTPIRAVLASGKVSITKPIMDEPRKAVLFGIIVPIFAPQGGIIGAAMGLIRLDRPNFLDKIIHNPHDNTGQYLLVSPKDHLIVTATDKRRIMEPSPVPGKYPMIDRLLAGYEGYAVFVNPRGEKVLQSSKYIPISGWYLATSLPTTYAFAPVNILQKNMLKGMLLFALLASIFTWWLVARMLRQQFAPLLAATYALNTPNSHDPFPAPLAIKAPDEVGELLNSFNRLLRTLQKREAALKTSEFRLHAALEGCGDGVWDWNMETNEKFHSPGWKKMLGYEEHEIMPSNFEWESRIYPGDHNHVIETLNNYLNGKRPDYKVELRLRCKDNTYKWILTRGVLVDRNKEGKPLRMIGIHTDISERKHLENQLKESEQKLFDILENVDACIYLKDTQERYLFANRKVRKLFGVTHMDEVIGLSNEHFFDMPSTLQLGEDDRQVINNGKTIRTERNNMRFKSGHTASYLMVKLPLRNSDGEIYALCGISTDITELKQAEEKVRQLAFYDSLTQLPNRTLLLERLKKIMIASNREQTFCAILFIDLDNFKTLNDTLGHQTGDLLLQEVAQRLSNCVRENDTVARLGGDEFVIVLQNLSNNYQEAAAQTELVGEKILKMLVEPYYFEETKYSCTASIGACLFKGHELTIDNLLKQADLAMYTSKDCGRNSFRFFDPVMQNVIMARAALERDLRKALTQHLFLLYYQPQIVDKKGIVGAEILLRWQDPQRGMVLPTEFISFAEEIGLIVPLGYWVLETACAQLAQWAIQPDKTHLTLAVNVSARQFQRHDFVTQILTILERTGVNPYRLKLELTESILADVPEIIDKMTALKMQGISFSLDDFGVGYSCLTYLKRLPLDQIKIDKSFIRDIITDPNDAAIAKTIVALAKSLELEVISEGVETEAQHNFVKNLGCRAHQGYFFSEPLTLEDFNSLATAQGKNQQW